MEPALHDYTVPGVNRRHSIMLSPISSCFFKPARLLTCKLEKKTCWTEFARQTVTFRQGCARVRGAEDRQRRSRCSCEATFALRVWFCETQRTVWKDL